MLVEQKQNKIVRPQSVYTLSAEETNQITEELENVITAGGLTPSANDLSQVKKAIDALVNGKLAPMAYYMQDEGVYVMNSQAVVNANSLLEATGNFRALNLDLSSNNLLTKLTANGTSGSLANLASVVVSKSAPFDNNTSPQIDVSYTELDRAALVNLFNSLPYNVGYTVMGSPTIASGVASGFTNSNYLITPISADFKNVTEFVIKIKPTSVSQSVAQYIFSGLGTGGSNAAYVRISPNNIYFTSRSTDVTFVSNPAVDTWYWLKYTNDGTEQKFYYSTDGTNYTLTATRNIQFVDNGDTRPLYFGRTSWGAGDEYSFTGEIDVSNSYFEINSWPWFTGKADMTKTCSVVGCTGTADLTQTDKDIALNKGWALTVA